MEDKGLWRYQTKQRCQFGPIELQQAKLAVIIIWWLQRQFDVISFLSLLFHTRIDLKSKDQKDFLKGICNQSKSVKINMLHCRKHFQAQILCTVDFFPLARAFIKLLGRGKNIWLPRFSINDLSGSIKVIESGQPFKENAKFLCSASLYVS